MRSTSLMRLNVVALNYKIGLLVIRKHLLQFEWWDKHWGFLLTNDQKAQNATAVYSNLGPSTFLMAFSILEGLIRQILFASDPEACNESTAGYYKVRKYLFENHLNLKHSDYASFFELISTVRNCFHNLGVYRDIKNKRRIIEHKGTRYTFLHMVPPNCLQPENLIAFLSEMGGVMFDIVSDPNVVALDRVVDPNEELGSHDTAEPI